MAGLSTRETEILDLVAQGHTNAEVAERLRISPLTVKKHLERMYEAAGARNRADLIARTYRRTGSLVPVPVVAGLPPARTSFIGREREKAEVASLLERARLVTLGGPGGIGKTRLGLEVAAAVAQRLPDGARFVDLSAVADPRLVASAIASALAVPEVPGQRKAALIAALRSAHLLLVLDNCEHIVSSCADIVADLLSACSGVRVLATSRTALGVPGEAFWSVPPLSLPDPSRAKLIEIAASEAVRLFVDRASLRAEGFDLAPENARTVAHVCRSLDGLPLAIELAAARLNELSVDDVAARLDDRFRELRTDAAEVTPRHRTLRSVVEWSHQLLAPAEAVLFERLAIFSGGFSLAAARSIAGGPGTDEIVVLDLLSRLVDKSFVIADLRGPEARYRMLETLHRFARGRLGDGPAAHDLARRHAEFFCALAEEAEPELKGPGQRRWFERLDADHENLRSALRWSFVHGPLLAARLASALWRFWLHRGHRVEGTIWLEQALALEGLPPRLRGRVLNGAGNLVGGSDLARSEALHRENLALQRSLVDGTVWDLTAALSNLGDRLRERGAVTEAKVLFLEALRLRGDDRWGLALTMSQLGHVAIDEDDLPEAERRYAEALRLWRASGDHTRAAGAVSFLARLAREQGRFGRAEQLYRRSVVIHRALGDRYAIARDLTLMSLTAKARGDDGRARQLFAAATSAHKEFGAALDGERIDQPLLRLVRQDVARAGDGAFLGTLEDAVEYALMRPA